MNATWYELMPNYITHSQALRGNASGTNALLGISRGAKYNLNTIYLATQNFETNGFPTRSLGTRK